MRVHDKGPVLRHGLADGLSLQQQHLGGFGSIGGDGERGGHVRAEGHHRFAAQGFAAVDCQRATLDRVDGAVDAGTGRNRQGVGCSGAQVHENGGELRCWVGRIGVFGRCEGLARLRVRDVPGPKRNDAKSVSGAEARDVAAPVHEERGLDHLGASRQVEPDLEELGGVAFVLVDEREHLAVHDALAGGEPLEVALAVAGGVAHGVRVVDDAVERAGEGFEAAVRVLREPGDAVPVVHPVRGGGVEVGAVAHARGLHLRVACRVVVLVVHSEQPRVQRGHGEREVGYFQDRRGGQGGGGGGGGGLGCSRGCGSTRSRGRSSSSSSSSSGGRHEYGRGAAEVPQKKSGADWAEGSVAVVAKVAIPRNFMATHKAHPAQAHTHAHERATNQTNQTDKQTNQPDNQTTRQTNQPASQPASQPTTGVHSSGVEWSGGEGRGGEGRGGEGRGGEWSGATKRGPRAHAKTAFGFVVSSSSLSHPPPRDVRACVRGATYLLYSSSLILAECHVLLNTCPASIQRNSVKTKEHDGGVQASGGGE